MEIVKLNNREVGFEFLKSNLYNCLMNYENTDLLKKLARVFLAKYLKELEFITYPIAASELPIYWSEEKKQYHWIRDKAPFGFKLRFRGEIKDACNYVKNVSNEFCVVRRVEFDKVLFLIYEKES